MCTGCRQCEYACPIDLPSAFDLNLGTHRAIRVPFSTAVPQYAVLDIENCLLCGKCEKACPVEAIDFTQQPYTFTIEADAVVVNADFAHAMSKLVEPGLLGIARAPAVELNAGLERMRGFRDWRAEEIGRRLAEAGIAGAFEGARERSNGRLISRTHFARFLVDEGYAENVREVLPGSGAFDTEFLFNQWMGGGAVFPVEGGDVRLCLYAGFFPAPGLF